jgi:TolB-like protein
VGTLRIIDRDYVEVSNLQRQSLFDENDAADSVPKAIAAARKIAAFNSQICSLRCHKPFYHQTNPYAHGTIVSEGERRLAAIMYTDIVGYTSLTQKDESSTLQALEEHRSLLRPHFSSHGGREIKTIGDGFLVEFPSALNAVLCAIAIQQMMHDRKLATGETISLRIGIHVGDVVEKGNDILGDAVNVASRIEPLAEHGGVCVSGQVYDQVRNKSDLPFVSLGEKSLKNVTIPVAVYKVAMPWEQSVTTEALVFPTNRIAVLPFTSFSSNPDDAYFADGMTEEVISTVSGISGLEVISRTSIMGYKGSTKKVEDIGRELKVGAVLEGSFRKAGNRIRVTAQLIEVAKDRHLWAQNYDRSLDDVFEVQSDVAKQVADALRVRILSPEKERIERKPTESTVAYTLYLRGRQLWNKRTLNDVREALTYFERAVKEDPNFALGYVGQADCYSVAQLVPNVEWFDKVKPLVAKALQLDPDLAEAHTTNGLVLACEYDLRHAEEEFKKAIELKPSYATAHQWYQLNVLVPELRWDEALRHIEKAVELDPLSPIMHVNLALYYMAKRDYSRAVEPDKRAVELGLKLAHGNLGWAYGMMKMHDDMKREFATWVEVAQDTYPLAKLVAEVNIAYCQDDSETLSRLLPELEAHCQEPLVSSYMIAETYFHLGENDKGFKWLERSYSTRESSLLDLTSEKDFDGVRTDPRYLDLLKRLGLS